MYRWYFLLVLCLFTFGIRPAVAATLYIQPSQINLNRGDAQIFQVRLDTDESIEECVNAISGIVQFAGPLSPIDVSTGNSILSIWLEPPAVNQAKNQVSFAGGIPNGYCGRIDGDPNLTNVLFEIVARTDADLGSPEVATVSFTNETTAYLNDGRGSLTQLTLLPSTVRVSDVVGDVVRDPWTEQVNEDTLPPQEFSILLEQDEIAFQGNYYISFSTTDKQTGIDHYQVMEEPLSQSSRFLWGSSDAPWRKVVSPFVLEDQSLNSIIRVKAVDKAGNEYVANLVPDEELRSLSFGQSLLYGLSALFFFFIAVVAFAVTRNRTMRQLEHFNLESDELATTSGTSGSHNITHYDR